jgi:RecA/RadA recombinase
MAVASVTTALDLWRTHEQDARALRCGCDTIDELLSGGFRSGLLTEVCGEASAGKTQLCLQLLLQSTLPPQLGGLGSTACYICTEGIGSIKRLNDLAGVYATRYGTRVATQRKRKREEDAVSKSNAFLDGIFIEQVYETEGLLELLVLCGVHMYV